MTYNDFKELLVIAGALSSTNDTVGMEQFIPYLNSAYKTVVNRIRLDPVILPMIIDSATVIDQFNNMCTMVDSNSEIAFKEIIGWPKSDECIGIKYNDTTTTAIIGNMLTDANFGLDLYNSYDDMEVYTNGSEITTNYDEAAKLLIHGYMYPYFMRTVNGYKVDAHFYDIETMIDTYDELDLVMDDTLVYLVSLKAMATMNLDNGAISLANSYDNLCNDTLNIYNENKATLVFDTITGMH